MSKGERLEQAVYSISCKSPNFACEGMVGYVETEVSIEVKDLQTFTELWQSWYVESTEKRNKLYSLMLGRK